MSPCLKVDRGFVNLARFRQYCNLVRWKWTVPPLKFSLLSLQQIRRSIGWANRLLNDLLLPGTLLVRRTNYLIVLTIKWIVLYFRWKRGRNRCWIKRLFQINRAFLLLAQCEKISKRTIQLIFLLFDEDYVFKLQFIIVSKLMLHEIRS